MYICMLLINSVYVDFYLQNKFFLYRTAVLVWDDQSKIRTIIHNSQTYIRTCIFLKLYCFRKFFSFYAVLSLINGHSRVLFLLPDSHCLWLRELASSCVHVSRSSDPLATRPHCVYVYKYSRPSIKHDVPLTLSRCRRRRAQYSTTVSTRILFGVTRTTSSNYLVQPPVCRFDGKSIWTRQQYGDDDKKGKKVSSLGLSSVDRSTMKSLRGRVNEENDDKKRIKYMCIIHCSRNNQ